MKMDFLFRSLVIDDRSLKYNNKKKKVIDPRNKKKKKDKLQHTFIELKQIQKFYDKLKKNTHEK